MNFDLNFLHYLFMALGAIAGANLGLRGQAVFIFILIMVSMLILLPMYIGGFIFDHFADGPKEKIPEFIPYGFMLILVLIAFRSFGEMLAYYLSPVELSPLEDKMLGLGLGVALGFFTAAILF